MDKYLEFGKIESNAMELKEWQGPELKIKFDTMEGYLNFLEKAGIKLGSFEENHLITLKSRYELSKVKDPRSEIFKRIEEGLRKRAYTGKLTFESNIQEIAKSIWGKDSISGYLNMYLPYMIGIHDSNMVRKDPMTIESAIEIAMDELVDYDIFHEFKGFEFDVNSPVELLHYLISHLYLSLAGRIGREKDSKFSMKLFDIKSSGFPNISADRLDIDLKMLPSYASEKFYYYNISTIKEGFKYSVNGSIPKELETPGQAIILRSDKIAIDSNNRHLDRSRYLKFHSYDGYDETAEKIIKIQKKIELYFKCLVPDIFVDNN